MTFTSNFLIETVAILMSNGQYDNNNSLYKHILMLDDGNIAYNIVTTVWTKKEVIV